MTIHDVSNQNKNNEDWNFPLSYQVVLSVHSNKHIFNEHHFLNLLKAEHIDGIPKIISLGMIQKHTYTYVSGTIIEIKNHTHTHFCLVLLIYLILGAYFNVTRPLILFSSIRMCSST